MSTHAQTEARALRSRLSHPIIDADGHWAEFHPLMRQEFRRIGGDTAVEALQMASARIPNSLNMSLRERRRRRIGQEAFWFLPTENTLDRATAMMPRLLYERLDDLGLDFCVIYPTAGLGYYRLPSDTHRRALCRAYNVYAAEQFRPYGDRIIPAAIVPMYSPEEAIEELEFASKQLGLRVVMLGSLIRRPIPALVEDHPDASKFVEWYDSIGIDSDYDYDPVWAKLRELRIAPSFHNGARSILLRNSPSNFCYNHIGHFASAAEATAKSLFFGGVTRRFPELNFGFLEGGVGWACSLYADLIGHWEKRNREAVEHYNPARLDRAQVQSLFEQYGSDRYRERLDQLDDGLKMLSLPDEHPATLDEFARCGITDVDDIRDVFTRAYHFGCEADDPMTALAFDPRRTGGPRLKALFASDIGHWDVPDIRDVLPEAWELVEDGDATEADFRALTFEHAVSLWAATNPSFFDGTSVEQEVRDELERVGVPG